MEFRIVSFEPSFFVLSLLTSRVFHWLPPSCPQSRHTPGPHQSSARSPSFLPRGSLCRLLPIYTDTSSNRFCADGWNFLSTAAADWVMGAVRGVEWNSIRSVPNWPASWSLGLENGQASGRQQAGTSPGHTTRARWSGPAVPSA